MSGVDLVQWLRGRLGKEQRAAEADDRHWSEVPISLFSAHRALAEIAAKQETLARYEAAEAAMDQAVKDGDEGGYNSARAERQALRPVLDGWARIYREEDEPESVVPE